jgi:hypothetical protein
VSELCNRSVRKFAALYDVDDLVVEIDPKVNLYGIFLG